jgi:cyclophilin family peptidyl-prolyl cis-trans isomerase
VTSGYFDNSRFFRVRPGDIAQFGIPGVGTGGPEAAQTVWGEGWRYRAIADDSVRAKNERGTLAFAMTGPNTRTTQLFVSLRDNSALDAQGFAPLGRVVKGMDVLDRLYAGYGDNAGGGMRARRQDPMFQGGNSYLDASFPRLDKLIRARIVGH